MLFLMLGVVGFFVFIICNMNLSFLWYIDFILLFLIVLGIFWYVCVFFCVLGGFLVVYYVYYLIIMGLGLYFMVEFFGVCDIWFVEILNINLRNVIKNLFVDYLF